MSKENNFNIQQYRELEKMEKAKACFLEGFRKVCRPGAETLLRAMKNKGFFEAPASRRNHGAYKGGLAEHSVNVYERLKLLISIEGLEERYESETVAIVALLHDLCKIDAYDGENGEYRHSGSFPVGHGEKSVILILQYMELTDEEIMAINWHMGGFDYRVKGGSYDMSNAFARYELAVLLHMADMMATYLDEREGKSDSGRV